MGEPPGPPRRAAASPQINTGKSTRLQESRHPQLRHLQPQGMIVAWGRKKLIHWPDKKISPALPPRRQGWVMGVGHNLEERWGLSPVASYSHPSLLGGWVQGPKGCIRVAYLSSPAHRPPPTPHTSLSFTAIAIPSTCCQLGTAYPCTSVSALHVCQCLF